MNHDKLTAFRGRILADLGCATSVDPVRNGARLGLYQALVGRPLTAAELATETAAPSATSRMARAPARLGLPRLRSGRCALHPPARTCGGVRRPEEPGLPDPGFDTAAALFQNQPLVEHGFRTGEGVLWGDQSGCLACATRQFVRPGYRANMLESWLPALDGVTAKLERGARVADVGGSHGFSTILMARAFPNAEFVGFDFHVASIEAAEAHAAEHGAPANLSFAVASAQDFPARDYDLVTFVNNLHSRFESFMRQFCSPATKNLPGYAARFITRLVESPAGARDAAWQRLLAA